jgi:hypothetical protein
MLFVANNGNTFIVALIAVAFFGFVIIIPPIIGYDMIQSYQHPNWGWFLLIGYPIIFISLIVTYALYKKNTNHIHHTHHTYHHTQLLQDIQDIQDIQDKV